MLFVAALTLSLVSVGVLAAPAVSNPFKRAVTNATAPTDTQVLQYALTLEHLEATFYSQALELFSEQDFVKAGFSPYVRGRVSEVSQHETTHVALLSKALGNDSVEACTYKFPYNDVRTFLVFACGLENIGVSAYLGAAKYISDKGYLGVATSITTVEARHQSFFAAPVLSQAPWTGPFDTPLELDMVYTLAAQLIVSCPATNPMLPVMAFPALTVMNQPIFDAKNGSTVQLMYNGSTTQTGMTYAAVYNGLGQAVYPIMNGSVTLPSGIQGYSFILVTSAADWPSISGKIFNPKSRSSNNTDIYLATNVIAGPAEVHTAFNSKQSNPGYINPIIGG